VSYSPMDDVAQCETIRPAAASSDPDLLSTDELRFVSGYRKLNVVTRLAIRHYLATGDDRLLVAIYCQVFLGLHLTHLRDQSRDEFGEGTTTVEIDQLPLVRR
jgi:hypothetical protein